MPRKRKYTAEVLAPIVATATSLADVIRKLGIRPSGGNHRMISARVREAGLDTSHFGWGTPRRVVEAIPADALVEAAKTSGSVAEVARTFSLPSEG